jgi:hypothetical protein
MNEYASERDRDKVAAAERPVYGRALAVGAVVVWLATMLLVLGPSATRGLF